MDRKWFTPKKGHTPLCPITRAVVPAHGKWVPASEEFYIRRVLDGDGELTDDMPQAAKAEELRLAAEAQARADEAKHAAEDRASESPHAE